MDHHCLYLLKCVAVDNHPLFIWMLILCLVNLACFSIGFLVFVYLKYGDQSGAEIFTNLTHHDCWPFSLFCLNFGSCFWVFFLLKQQWRIVTIDCTSYFTPEYNKDKISKLSTRQRWENFADFLQYKTLRHKYKNSPFYEPCTSEIV